MMANQNVGTTDKEDMKARITRIADNGGRK